MTARRPSDPMGGRLWELEEGYCGESEHVDDLITLAWNLYHARDTALALAERRAGALRRVRLWIHNDASDVGGVDAMLRTVNTALAAPPPASEDTGGAR